MEPHLTSRNRKQSTSLYSDLDEALPAVDTQEQSGRKPYPPSGLDEKLLEVDQGYSTLMDRIQVLKEMRKTPERDQEVNRLMKVKIRPSICSTEESFFQNFLQMFPQF